MFLVCCLIFQNCKTIQPQKTVGNTAIKEKILALTNLPGVQTHAFLPKNYSSIYYVDGTNGNDENNGSQQAPVKQIHALLQKIKPNNTQRIAICVAEGVYSEPTLILSAEIDIWGGFSRKNWERNIEKYPTYLDGGNKHTILKARGKNKIDGFYFTKGSVRGNGGAILCEGTSPTISNNYFIGNRTLKPDGWNPTYLHETAHDGGAIYGKNGAAPLVQNNIFTDNQTENGRGAAIAFDNKCQPAINNNVFINNVAGLDDPMRSSDGGAISIFRWCNAQISNNYFLSNKAISKNDGGALFIALWSTAEVTNNVFVDSESGDDAGALFVGGQEHRYDAPLDPIPPKEQFYVTINNNRFFGNRNSSMNSGAMRFTMESRGEFTNNVVAHNNGIYFQRSEVTVRRQYYSG